MADLVWGEPVVGGETLPPDSSKGSMAVQASVRMTERGAVFGTTRAAGRHRDFSSSRRNCFGRVCRVHPPQATDKH